MKSQTGRAQSLRGMAVGTAIAMMSGASVAQAADIAAQEPPPEPVRQSEWSVTVTPYLWGAALSGHGALRGYPIDIDVPFSETLENLDLGLMGVVEIDNGKFGAFINAEYVDVSDDQIFHPRLPIIGQQEVNVDAGLTMTIISAGVSYRVFETNLGGTTAFGAPRVFSVAPLVGARWTRLEGDLSVEVPGVAYRDVSDSKQWLDPFVGARADIDLSSRWNLTVEGDVGGFDIGSKITLNGQAYLGYRTHFLGHETILRLGYRALYQDYTDGGFEWDVTQHGPVVGASFKF
jgi:hypothetical protein